jgi:K(+)-stimulated pyrophosphate-energized sodium pump
MRVAVISNSRVAQVATSSKEGAVRMAFNGGAVTGLLVVGLGLLSVGIFFLIGEQLFGRDRAIASLVGLGLGASLISVFARLGGGIYTKAADVGADLVGKLESHWDEDDPRIPPPSLTMWATVPVWLRTCLKLTRLVSLARS